MIKTEEGVHARCGVPVLNMKVILLEDVKKLGKADDIVEVNDGYARNFLIKKGVALEASTANLNSVRVKKAALSEKARREKEDAQATGEKLSGKTFTLQMKSGEGGKLYGAVTAMDVASLLEKEGFSVDKKNVTLKNPIKTEGVFEASVKLHTDVTVPIKVEIKTAW